MIQIHDLSKSFGDLCALDHVSFDLAKGDSVVIRGPSGSGKTTLLRLIAGLETPDEGEIRMGGKLVSKPGHIVHPSQRGIGFVFQSPALWPHLTVAQNILFGLGRFGNGQAEERLKDILAQVELSGLAGRYPAQLSGGQVRRVSLARALAPNPALLLMDEPLTHVQPDLKLKLAHLLRDSISQNGTTLVYVTHDNDEADLIPHTHLMEMHSGRLVDGFAPIAGNNAT